MPLPKPGKNESKGDFIDRCMGDSTMNREYPDADRRRAVCETQWDNRNKASHDHTNLINLIQDEAWGIVPEKLDAIHQALWDHLNGVEIDLTTYAAQVQAQEDEEVFYTIHQGVAVIPIYGILSKRMNFFTMISGGTSTQLLLRDFRTALEDDDVEAIVFRIDSPGGTIDGLDRLGDEIYTSRGKKPIVAFGDGLMASAAYLIGSAADAVMAETTTVLGSIGVVMTHYDYSGVDERKGIKRTHVYAGRYKTVGTEIEPLSDASKQILQSRVDYLYSLFVNTIARNRDVEIETVLTEMADGQVFIGQQAVQAGLIDRIGTIDAAVDLALSLESGTKETFFRMEATMPLKKLEEIQTIEQLAAAYPELVTQLREEGAKSIDIEKIMVEARNAERNRILGLTIIQFGAEAGEKFKAVVETGVTMEQFKAIQAVKPAETEGFKEKMLEAIQTAGAENPGSTGSFEAESNKDFMTRVEEHMAKNKCKKSEAVEAIMKIDPEAHQAWLKSQSLH